VLRIGSASNLGASTSSLDFSDGTLQVTNNIVLPDTRDISTSSFASFDSNGYNLTVMGTISGYGGVRKSGPGNLIITGSNSYMGQTRVEQGRLVVSNQSALGGSGGFGETHVITVLSGAAVDLTGISDPINSDYTFDGSGAVLTNGLTFTSGGVLRGDFAFSGSLVNSGGLVAPGVVDQYTRDDSIGVINVSGNYTQAVSGELEINIDQLSDYDRLKITDVASLGGLLRLKVSDEFRPEPGDTITIMSASAIDGGFSFFEVTDLDGNLQGITLADGSPALAVVQNFPDKLNVRFIEGSGLLNILNVDPGDMNRVNGIDEGDIDYFVTALRDRLAYQNLFEDEDADFVPADIVGDVNDDGMLDFEDISAFLEKLENNGIPASTALAAIKAQLTEVPEPTGASLCIIVTIGVLACTREGKKPWCRS